VWRSLSSATYCIYSFRSHYATSCLTLVTRIFSPWVFSEAASDRADRRADGASATFANISHAMPESGSPPARFCCRVRPDEGKLALPA
jgi:hypothetical protein